MIRLASKLNKFARASKLIFAQVNDAFSNFFSLYQNRLKIESPEQIAQKMMQEPIFSKFLENAIKTHIEKTYSTYQPRTIEDTSNQVFEKIVDNLPGILSRYDPKVGVPLIGWLRSTINQYSKSIINIAKNQQEFSIDSRYQENKLPFNAGGVNNTLGGEYADFLPQMHDKNDKDIQNLKFEITDLSEKLQSREFHNLPLSRQEEVAKAIKNQIADKKNRLNSYYNQPEIEDDTSDLEPEYTRPQMIENSVQKIPYEQLSNIIESQMQYKKGRGMNSENRFYPASSFFTPDFGDEEISTKMSKILIESMMRAGKTQALTNTKNNMFESRQPGEKMKSMDFRDVLIQTLIQIMGQNQIEPYIQEQMLNHVVNCNERELQHKPRELDEMARMAYYTLEKNNMFPDKTWNQLTDAEKEQISSSAQKQMEYGFGNEMAVRKFNTDGIGSDAQYTSDGVGRLSRPTQNMTPEMRNQLMIQEMNNISKGQRGFSVPATLPHNSPYFYKPKPKTSPEHLDLDQEVFYSPQAAGQAYVNACCDEIKAIRTASQILIDYSDWCDKNELYHEANTVQLMIREAMVN